MMLGGSGFSSGQGWKASGAILLCWLLVELIVNAFVVWLLSRGRADVYDPKPRLVALEGGVTSCRSAAISRNHNHMHSSKQQ
jgi:hypothetical protein